MVKFGAFFFKLHKALTPTWHSKANNMVDGIAIGERDVQNLMKEKIKERKSSWVAKKKKGKIRAKKIDFGVGSAHIPI